MSAVRFLCALSPLLLAAASAGCAEPADPPRHLVLITIDTLRADHLSAWGAPRATSDAAGAARRGSAPGFTLDELAGEGVRFEQAFAPIGMTFPSIATLMTGLTPIENGTLENGAILGAAPMTLAEELSQRGFRCAAFTTNRLLVRGSGIEQGFEQLWSDASERRDELALDAARAWILAQDLERGPRLFVWVHLMGPHMPYEPPPSGGVDFARLFADPAYDGPVDGSRAQLDRAYSDEAALSEADVAAAIALYDGEVARIDQLVSRFARFLGGEPGQPRDLLTESLLVVAADHGEELHQRNGYWGHSKSVYASVLHVPLAVRHPSSLHPRIVEAPFPLGALRDALLEWLDLPAPPDALQPVLDPRGLVFGQWRERVFTAFDGRWRLVWNPKRVEPDDPPPGRYPIPELALFDRESDPLELVDVSADHPEEVARLRGAIEGWRVSQRPPAVASPGPDAERLRAMRDLGYAGEESGDEHERERDRSPPERD